MHIEVTTDNRRIIHIAPGTKEYQNYMDSMESQGKEIHPATIRRHKVARKMARVNKWTDEDLKETHSIPTATIETHARRCRELLDYEYWVNNVLHYRWTHEGVERPSDL